MNLLSVDISIVLVCRLYHKGVFLSVLQYFIM